MQLINELYINEDQDKTRQKRLWCCSSIGSLFDFCQDAKKRNMEGDKNVNTSQRFLPPLRRIPFKTIDGGGNRTLINQWPGDCVLPLSQ